MSSGWVSRATVSTQSCRAASRVVMGAHYTRPSPGRTRATRLRAGEVARAGAALPPAGRIVGGARIGMRPACDGERRGNLLAPEVNDGAVGGVQAGCGRQGVESLLPVGGQPGRCMAGREELGHALDGNRQPGFAAERLPGLLEALER